MARIKFPKVWKSSCQTGMVCYLPPLSTPAGVAKSVYAQDSKSCGAIHEGSIPSSGTTSSFLTQPELLWGLAHGFFEAAGEVVAVLKPTVKGDVGDGAVGMF